jgi:hypothetical protein
LQPLILEATGNADLDVRRAAIGALPRCYFGDDGAAVVRDHLATALKDADAGVRETAAAALGETGDLDAGPAILPALKDAEPAVRRAGAYALYAVYRYQRPGDDKVRKEILKNLKNEKDPITRTYLGVAYGCAAPDEENTGAYYDLSDNGYWAFFSGNWAEKDLESYYTTVEGGSGGG